MSKQITELTISLEEEMNFRLSLFRLMTSPHQDSRSVAPETRELEEMAVLVPRQSR
ncbi:MAG: hypothetical protein U0Q16_12755 [Bryobacteraceae bacterium]